MRRTTYNTAGNRTVKLTVSDGKGGTATRDIPVQVLAADDPAKKLRALVFSKTAGFRHDSIPAEITAIQGSGRRRELAGRQHRGRVAVHRRRAVALRRRDLPLDDG